MGIDLLQSFVSPFEQIDRMKEAELRQSLDLIASQISSLGYPCRPFSKRSMLVYRTLSQRQQDAIRANVASLLRFVSLYDCQYAGKSHSQSLDVHPEKAQIEMALGFFDLELRDKFWDIVDGEDIIEIYNQDQIQVFRTLNFFKITGYTVLDLLSVEWFELWHRSSLVLKDFMTFANDVYLGRLGPGRHLFGLQEHVVKEIYDDGEVENFHERVSLARFKYMCPLYRPGETQVGGVIITSQGRALPAGNESASVLFI